MVATDEKIWRTNLSGKHRRGGAATCSVPPKSVDPFSQTFTYDPLNRLVANTLGGVTNQSRTLDTDYVLLRQEPKSRLSEGAAYRETSYTSYGTTQTETANAQNQITSISGSTAPTYDANGNMTTGSLTSQPAASVTMVYNAWNQLVEVKNAGGAVIVQYSYNALGQRTSESYPVAAAGIPAGTVKYLYYSASSIPQVIEERWNGTASNDVQYQYVWSAIVYSVYGMIALHVPINDPGPALVIFGAGTMLLASLPTGAASCTVGWVLGMAVSAGLRPGYQNVAATGGQRHRTAFAAVALPFIGFAALDVVALACVLRATTAPHPGSLGAASEPTQLGLIPTVLWLVLTGNIWAYVAAAAIAFRRNPRSNLARLLAAVAVPLAAFGVWCMYRGAIPLFLL